MLDDFTESDKLKQIESQPGKVDFALFSFKIN